MENIIEIVSKLSLSAIAGYLLGSIPLAYQISKRKGINIFKSGTGLAGASNVLHSVGKKPAAIVFWGDFLKGFSSILFSILIGIEGHWLIIPALASIMGHWNSIFTKFKGGDGMVTLAGATVGAFPIIGLTTITTASFLTLLLRVIPYITLIGFSIGGFILFILNMIFYSDLNLATGYFLLYILVVVHALRGHRKRRLFFEKI